MIGAALIAGLGSGAHATAHSSTAASFAQVDEVVSFWRDAGPTKWFAKDMVFDLMFRARFLQLHEAAARGELQAWADAAEGALALVILLDQFPRNAFRSTARKYVTDVKALAVAERAISKGLDTQLDFQSLL